MTAIIIDNFMDSTHLDNLDELWGGQGALTTERMPLYYTNKSVPYGSGTGKEESLNNKFSLKGVAGELGGHFSHVFFDEFNTQSPYHETVVVPILKVLEPLSLIRAKMNINVQEAGSEHTGWHIDYLDSPGYFTGVLYLNTVKGTGTLLEDGTFIESVANRFAYFPGETYHTGVLGKDIQGARATINLNFTVVP